MAFDYGYIRTLEQWDSATWSAIRTSATCENPEPYIAALDQLCAMELPSS